MKPQCLQMPVCSLLTAPTNRPLTQSINQSINQPMDESISLQCLQHCQLAIQITFEKYEHILFCQWNTFILADSRLISDACHVRFRWFNPRFPSTVITVQFSHDAGAGTSGGPLRSRTYDGLEVSLEQLGVVAHQDALQKVKPHNTGKSGR